MVLVLPLPAPAITSTGPSVAVAASNWAGFKSACISKRIKYSSKVALEKGLHCLARLPDPFDLFSGTVIKKGILREMGASSAKKTKHCAPVKFGFQVKPGPGDADHMRA